MIKFDARNHGDSPQSEAHNYDLMTQDVIQLPTKTLKISRFSFMGHGMPHERGWVEGQQWCWRYGIQMF